MGNISSTTIKVWYKRHDKGLGTQKYALYVLYQNIRIEIGHSLIIRMDLIARIMSKKVGILITGLNSLYRIGLVKILAGGS